MPLHGSRVPSIRIMVEQRKKKHGRSRWRRRRQRRRSHYNISDSILFTFALQKYTLEQATEKKSLFLCNVRTSHSSKITGIKKIAHRASYTRPVHVSSHLFSVLFQCTFFSLSLSVSGSLARSLVLSSCAILCVHQLDMLEFSTWLVWSVCARISQRSRVDQGKCRKCAMHFIWLNIYIHEIFNYSRWSKLMLWSFVVHEWFERIEKKNTNRPTRMYILNKESNVLSHKQQHGEERERASESEGERETAINKRIHPANKKKNDAKKRFRERSVCTSKRQQQHPRHRHHCTEPKSIKNWISFSSLCIALDFFSLSLSK